MDALVAQLDSQVLGKRYPAGDPTRAACLQLLKQLATEWVNDPVADKQSPDELPHTYDAIADYCTHRFRLVPKEMLVREVERELLYRRFVRILQWAQEVRHALANPSERQVPESTVEDLKKQLASLQAGLERFGATDLLSELNAARHEQLRPFVAA